MKTANALFLFGFLLLISCGTIQSVSAIQDADKSRNDALNKITEITSDKSLVVEDEFGNKTLLATTGGEAAYYYFMAEAYLKKARDLQSKGEHERAKISAEKSREFAHKTVLLMESMKKVDEPKNQTEDKVKTPQERASTMTIEPAKTPDQNTGENK